MSDPYRDPALPVGARVDDLLGRMTLEEKVRQLGCVWSTALVTADRFDPERAREALGSGIGHVTRIGAATGLGPEQNARFMNQIQEVLVEGTRLGIPAVVHEEAVAGFCARGATQFPHAIGLASTFDPDGIRAMAEVARRQMVAVGARYALAPVLDIARDPRWGRLEETYGEDPYLAGRLGVACVRGLQGDDLREGVVATGKHFLGYGLPEGGMNHAPVQLGRRQLREVFAEPFAAVIRDAGLRSVMNSYSSIDGVPVGASKEILDDLLRGELGFDGVVVADYFTTALLISDQRVAADRTAAARLALEAGIDVELPALDCFAELVGLVEAEQLDEACVDRAVRRVLKLKFELGLFEKPYVDAAVAAAVFDTPPQRQLARDLAARSMVLLKNDGVLPLVRGQKIAVLGPLADDARLLQGDYSYPAHTEIVYRRAEMNLPLAPTDAGAGGPPAPDATFAAGPHFPPMSTPLAALNERQVELVRVVGASIDGTEVDGGIAEAVRAAQACDVALVFVGGRSGLLPDCTSGEFRDASDLGLTGEQSSLVRAVAATGVPVVTVVLGGRAFALPDVAEASSALVMGWLPGEEGGRAIADVLYGDVNPAGRLPVSLARSVGQVPVYYNHKSGGGRSAFFGDYSDGPTTPLFPFGHGLSYARFEYEDLTCPESVDVHGMLRVAATVRNVAAVDGEEVVQLYLHDRVASVARPVRQLAGFRRVAVAAGESVRVTFDVDPSQLAFYDAGMAFVVEPGEIDVMLGASSSDVRLQATVTVTGERRALTQRQVVATQVEVN